MSYIWEPCHQEACILPPGGERSPGVDLFYCLSYEWTGTETIEGNSLVLLADVQMFLCHALGAVSLEARWLWPSWRQTGDVWSVPPPSCIPVPSPPASWAGRMFCPPSSRQHVPSQVLREKGLEGFQGITGPSHAQTSPQWCRDHRADATSD